MTQEPAAITALRVSSTVRLGIAAVIGVLIGVGTSFAQAGFSGSWQALSNSASPWLLGAFVAGAIVLTGATAVAAGLGACVLEVVGYYITTTARGYSVSRTEIAFWLVCAVIGGPLYGWAGWAWRRAQLRARAVAGAFAPATFLAEAIGSYQLRLHYTGDVLLYLGIGVALLIALAASQPHARLLLAATLALTGLGIIGYWLVLGRVAGAAFGA